MKKNIYEVSVYSKISKNLGIATHRRRFESREAAEFYRKGIEAQDTEHRLETVITEIKDDEGAS